MKVYVNGCSFSYGNTLENKSAWPDFIEDYDVINESWIGSSNKRIIRRTIEYIQTHAYEYHNIYYHNLKMQHTYIYIYVYSMK